MADFKLVVEDLFAAVIAEVPLGDEPVSIGRDPDCRVILASPFVSRRQAEVRRHEGRWALHSLGLNGTYVNRRLVREDEPAPLAPGDVVSITPFTLKVVDAATGGRRRRDRLELMRQYSELEARLHEALLRQVDLRSLGRHDLEEGQRKERILTAMDQVLDQELGEPAGELTELIVEEAFRRGLMDRLFLEREAAEEPGKAGHLWGGGRLEGAFRESIERLARLLGVRDPGASLRERIEIIAARFDEVFEQHRRSLTADLMAYVVRQAVRHDLAALVFGLGPIEDLLRMPDLNEVMVVGRNRIFVEKAGRLEETGRTFPRDDDLEVVIGRIVAPIGRFVNRSQPICDARLADGSRVNVVIQPVSIKGPAITIRKFRKDPYSLEDLAQLGTLNRRALAFLRGCVRARKNMIISGGTGSGKTTLLNTLGSQIPPHERIVVIEDAAELQLPQPNLVCLEAKKANVEGEGEISIRDLVRNALRMRPDRIVVGECRGKEALDMLQAMNTGHDGSLTTAHANSPEELISRLEVMVLEAGESLPIPAIHRQIAGAVDVIVQIQRQRDRSRKITHVSEVVGFDAEEQRILVQDVFRLVEPAEPAGAPPELRFTGYLPSFIEDLLRRGDTRLEELF